MKFNPQPKNKRAKSTKITQSANGKECTFRIPGVCNRNSETTVFAHDNGGGTAYKHHDIHGGYACSDCHYWYDEDPRPSKMMKDAEMKRAMIETQSILIQKGLIKI